MYSKVQEKQEFLPDNKIKEEESTGTKCVIHFSKFQEYRYLREMQDFWNYVKVDLNFC